MGRTAKVYIYSVIAARGTSTSSGFSAAWGTSAIWGTSTATAAEAFALLVNGEN